jgi:hypothetical protein
MAVPLTDLRARRLPAQAGMNPLRPRCNTGATLELPQRAQEKTMNRARLLMFAALLMAFAGFTMLSQSVQAGHDGVAEWSLALGR